MERAKVSEAELARRSGVARSVIYRVRRGEGGSAENLVKLAGVTGLRVEDMLPAPAEPEVAPEPEGEGDGANAA